MSWQRRSLLSVLLLCLGTSVVVNVPSFAQPAESVEFLDRLGNPTAIQLENGRARLRVVDPGWNYYPHRDVFSLEISSASTGDQEQVRMRETGPSTGVFEGTIELGTGPSGFGNQILETQTGPAPDFTLATILARHRRLNNTFITATATVAPSVTTFVDEFGNEAAAYTVGHPVRVRVEDHNLDSPLVVGVATVQLTTLSSDLEALTLVETGADTQIYEGSIGSNTGPTFGVPGDGAVQLIFQGGDQVTARHGDVNAGTESTDTAGSTSATIVFLDENGRPATSFLEGSRVYLRVYEYLGSWSPYQEYRSATIQAAISGDQADVFLWETGLETGIFEGFITISTNASPYGDQLQVSRNPGSPMIFDTLTASFAAYEAPVATATAAVRGASETFFIDENGQVVDTVPAGGRVRVRVRYPAETASTLIVTLRSLAFNETESVTLYRSAAGSDLFEGSIPMVQSYPTPSNGTLEVYIGEDIEAAHVAAGGATSKATALTSLLRIQFLDGDGEPTDRLLLGGPVRLRLLNPYPQYSDDTLFVTSSATADAEEVTMSPTSVPGVSEGSVPMGIGTFGYNNGRLDVSEDSSSLPADYGTIEAAIACSGSNLCPKVEARITSSIVTFVNEQGYPVDAYAIGGRVYVRLDRYIGNEVNAVDQAQVVVRSLFTGSEETVTLFETGANTNRFVGSVLTADADGPATTGRVRVRIGDPLSVAYTNSAGTAGSNDTAKVLAGTIELVDADGNPAESYLMGTEVHIRAIRPAANTNPGALDSVPLNLRSIRGDLGIYDTDWTSLTETGPDTGIFTGTVPLPHSSYPSYGDGQVQVYYGATTWDSYVNPMIVEASFYNVADASIDRAGTRPSILRFVDAQGNDTETVTLGSPIRLQIEDHRSGDPWDIGTVRAWVTSLTSGDTVAVILTETGPATSLYEAVVPTEAGPAQSGDSTLQATDGEILRAAQRGFADDPDIASDTATVGTASANQPPNAFADQITVQEDSSPTITLNVLANDFDPEGQPLQLTAIDFSTSGGTVSFAPAGSITFTPNPNFYGVVTVDYTVSDGTLTATATATFIVDPVLDGPVANPDTVTILEGGTSGQIAVLNNDQVGDTLGLSVGAVTNGAHGTAVNQGNTWVVYTATDTDFVGTDTFTYTLEDGAGLTATGTVTVVIEPVDDGFLAQDDAATTNEDTAATINVLANDIDVDSPKSVTAVTQGTNGTVVLNPDSTITYTPRAEFSGTDTFTYTGLGSPNDDTATVTVTVTPVNDPPTGVDDSTTTDEDTAVTVPVLANDTDSEGNTLSVSAVTQGAHGTVTFTATGVTYTPAAEYSGSDSFIYTLSDGNGGTDTAAVSVTVNSVNDAPDAANDSATTAEDTPVTITVLSNDSDKENQTLSVTAVTQATHGTVVLNPDGTVLYAPAENYNGFDSFTYTLSDGNGTDTGTVNVTVTAVNDAPKAVDDTGSGPEDNEVIIHVLDNDSDPEGQTLFFSKLTDGANGLVAIRADKALRYIPRANFNGTDTFTYTISDGSKTATASVTVTLTAVNDVPLANNDSYSGTEDRSETMNVLANDRDSDQDPLTITAVTQGAHGSVTFTATSVTYAPALNYNGPDSFTYTITDGKGGTATGTVSINLIPLNDDPILGADTGTTPEDTAITLSVLANDVDPENDPLEIRIVSPPTRGTVTFTKTSITYTPAANFSGVDTFYYVVHDGTDFSDTSGKVTVTVTAINDPPVAVDDIRSVQEDFVTTINVLSNDTDADNNTLTITAVTQPTHGSVSFTATSAIYTPVTNYNGADSFTYTISDGNGSSATATVSLTVTPVNDTPVAVADSGSTSEDTAVTISVLSNDSDPDNDVLAVTAVTQPSNGSVTFNTTSVTYTPPANFSGSASFTYTVSDGNGRTATSTVSIIVAAVNDPPSAINDAASTSEGTAVIISVLANDIDVDGGALQVTAVTQGVRGTVTINANGTVTYVPNPNTSGVDSFSYTVRDAGGITATATVTVNVAAVNDAPVAVADAAVTRENTAVGITVLSNDTDVEGNTLSVVSVSTPAFGTAVGNPGNSITYTPVSNFNGSDTFTYTVSDGQGGTSTATVTVTVKDALERVAVLGTNSVFLQTGSDVLSGDVIANRIGTAPFLDSSVELSIAGTVTTAAGYDVQANRLNLASGSTVAGDAFFNQRTGTGSITGNQTSSLTLPIFQTLPTFQTATPGATNINVSNSGTRTLAAGSYGDLVVGRKATVTFSGGTYHFRSIRVDRESKLIFNGASQVRVQQKLSTGILTTIGPATGAAFDASSLIFYVGGVNGTGGGLAETPKAAEIGADNILNVNFYVPNGTLWIKDRAQATGAFLAKDVQVGLDAQVSLDSFYVGQ